jgi:LysR family transcriptional regulator, transcriptional activator for bauABCD operon
MRRLLDVDLRLLTILRAIVECNGLSSAQNVLNMSESRVSAGLAELEARLGLRLCRRGRAGFALTEAGRVVYEASHELFDSVNRFKNRVHAVSDSARGILRIGTVDALITNDALPLARTLQRFRKATKNVTIDFLNAGPEELEAQVLSGRRDVAIGPYGRHFADLDYVPLRQELQSLYCGSDHALFAVPEKRITIAELVRHPFVARSYLHRFDLLRVGHVEAQASVDTMEAQLILILSGEFFGYLPAHYAKSWVAKGDLRVMKPKELSYHSSLQAVTAKQSVDNRLIKRFVDLLAEECSDRDDLGAESLQPLNG